jgi:hypothetical protein
MALATVLTIVEAAGDWTVVVLREAPELKNGDT